MHLKLNYASVASTFWSQKLQKPLTLMIVDNFHYFWYDIGYDVTVTSYMRCCVYLASMVRGDP